MFCGCDMQIITRSFIRYLKVARYSCVPVPTIKTSSSMDSSSYSARYLDEKDLMKLVRECIPPLDDTRHKGEAGRVGIVGGSLEYTGAPYFAAISALKVGADLSHVFCTKEAAPVIKSYSPELIVHPILDVVPKHISEEISPWLERLHVLVIGPGLGRDPQILQGVKQIIKMCRAQSKPIIIDADGLFLVTENIDLIKDYPHPGVILTPNKVEFARLYNVIKKEQDNNTTLIDFDKLGSNVYILQKGPTDKTYCKDDSRTWSFNLGGSGRRCGGQGDLLAGSMATFFNWATQKYSEPMLAAAVASFAASRLTRVCNEKAFRIKARSMVCSDMIEKIHETFDDEFELPQ